MKFKTPRRLRNPKVGDYVFASRWGDRSPMDPHAVGWILAVMRHDCDKGRYRVTIGDADGNVIYREFKYRHCWRLPVDGAGVLNEYARREQAGVGQAPKWKDILKDQRSLEEKS